MAHPADNPSLIHCGAQTRSACALLPRGLTTPAAHGARCSMDPQPHPACLTRCRPVRAQLLQHSPARWSYWDSGCSWRQTATRSTLAIVVGSGLPHYEKSMASEMPREFAHAREPMPRHPSTQGKTRGKMHCSRSISASKRAVVPLHDGTRRSARGQSAALNSQSASMQTCTAKVSCCSARSGRAWRAPMKSNGETVKGGATRAGGVSALPRDGPHDGAPTAGPRHRQGAS